MRDHEKSFCATTGCIPGGFVDLEPSVEELFPLSVRIAGRLADILLAAQDIQAIVATDHGAPVRPILPVVDAVYAEADRLIHRLAC